MFNRAASFSIGCTTLLLTTLGLSASSHAQHALQPPPVPAPATSKPCLPQPWCELDGQKGGAGINAGGQGMPGLGTGGPGPGIAARPVDPQFRQSPTPMLRDLELRAPRASGGF